MFDAGGGGGGDAIEKTSMEINVKLTLVMGGGGADGGDCDDDRDCYDDCHDDESDR